MSDEEILLVNSREMLLKKYLALREQADTIDKKVEQAKRELQDSLGEIEEIHLMGLKVLYRFNKELNAARIQQEQPTAYYECLKEPTLDPGKFRKLHADLVDKYEVNSKTRPLKVVI